MMLSLAEIKEAIQLLSQQQIKELYQFIAEIMSISMLQSEKLKDIVVKIVTRHLIHVKTSFYMRHK